MTAYLNITGSGYMNNPVRTIIIDRDNRPGSYPTHTSPVQQRRPESADLIRPYRDDLALETPVVYAQARMLFYKERPAPGDTVDLVDASGATHQFIFKELSGPSPSVNTYIVGLESTVATERSEQHPGLSPDQITIKNVTSKFIVAVNSILGAPFLARAGRALGEIVLEQRVPGSVGNQNNATTSAFISLENFSGGRDTGVRYPYGIFVDDGNPGLTTNEIVRRVVRGVRSGTLDVPTSGRATQLDAPSDGHPFVCHSPFDESGACQAFGVATGGSPLYGTQGGIEGVFFSRGSVSGSLDEPLRVKDKIEIDLTPVSETTLLSMGDETIAPNYPMAYFNFVTRRWEPIGFGLGISGLVVPTTLQDALDAQYLGFSQGWGNYIANSSTSNVSVLDAQLASQYMGTKSVFQEAGWFTPIDTFGFPLHPKYHATGSQQLDCELLVDRPFLLEKIVYEFSASMPNLLAFIDLTAPGDGEYKGSGGTFFILNQRKANPDPGQETSYTNVYVAKSNNGVTQYATPQDGGTNGPAGDYWSLPYNNGGIPRTMQLSPSGPSVYVDTVRDLVTFARVGTVWPAYDEEIESLIEPGFPHPATFMDLAIEVPATGTFSGAYTMAAPVRAPSQNSAVATVTLINDLSPDDINTIYVSKDTSTRNSIDLPTGRAYNGEFLGPEISYRVDGFQLSKQIFAPKVDSANSPYLIRPGDRLVFGWQAPTYFTLTDDNEAKTLKILPGKGKLTLYGSYLQDDKPVHDIFKDQLNSDAAHESIPTGPWALDRFESEPQMVYSSSMREEHVTGTMLTRRSDGSLSVTDVGDLGIGGVRTVSARASDGNLGQRWSFFRNTRLFDSEEQYYDSMQPDPLKALTLYGTTGERFNNGPHLGLMIPGTINHDNPFIDTLYNKTWIGSFPFESQYADIERVKTVNREILSRSKIIAYNGTVEESIVGIVFATGSITPTATPVSNLLAPGGITPGGISLTATHVFPNIDALNDTNLVRALGYGVDNIANPRVAITELPRNQEILYHFSRFMGCFGDGYFRMVQFASQYVLDSTFSYVRNMLYRGIKHGLINPTPLFSNAVFNGTRYGQLRDMMEQRQYTRFSLADSSLTDAAVEVVFIDRSVRPDINGSVTNNITSGSATNSSNISHYATSEHPYDDGLADLGLIWDRITPLPETLITI